ncbi:dynamin-related protein 3A, partial [Tanacetum coccineum]
MPNYVTNILFVIALFCCNSVLWLSDANVSFIVNIFPDGYTIDKSLKMSHCCMANELQRFPVLRKRMDDVIRNFLRDGLQPSETMIGHIVEME